MIFSDHLFVKNLLDLSPIHVVNMKCFVHICQSSKDRNIFLPHKSISYIMHPYCEFWIFAKNYIYLGNGEFCRKWVMGIKNVLKGSKKRKIQLDGFGFKTLQKNKVQQSPPPSTNFGWSMGSTQQPVHGSCNLAIPAFIRLWCNCSLEQVIFLK